VILFIYNDEGNIILKNDYEIWDTIRGYPEIDQSDDKTLINYSKSQFNIKINIKFINHIHTDNLGNKYYIYYYNNLLPYNIKFEYIKNYNFLVKYEDKIDYFIYYNIKKLYFSILKNIKETKKNIEKSKENNKTIEKARKKIILKQQGLINSNSIYCDKCDQYSNCICNSKRNRKNKRYQPYLV